MSLQITFLLRYLEDSRDSVKLSVLKDLKYVGERGGHLWDASQISSLIHFILARLPDPNRMETEGEYFFIGNSSEICHTSLDVINTLTCSSAILSFIHVPGEICRILLTFLGSGRFMFVFLFFIDLDSPLWTLIERSIHSGDRVIALNAIQIATYIAFNW